MRPKVAGFKLSRRFGSGDVIRERSQDSNCTAAGGVWNKLCQMRGDASDNDAVFPSREGDADGHHLDRSQVYRIVAAAGKRAGIKGKVSPHWLRHAHVSLTR